MSLHSKTVSKEGNTLYSGHASVVWAMCDARHSTVDSRQVLSSEAFQNSGKVDRMRLLFDTILVRLLGGMTRGSWEGHTPGRGKAGTGSWDETTHDLP